MVEFASHMVGQERAREQVALMLEAAEARDSRVPSMLFRGPAGHGKTTLAQAVAEAIGGNMTTALGANLQHAGALTRTVLTATAPNDDGEVEPCVVFIDEIHRASTGALETLYSVIEEGVALLSTGGGSHARQIRFEVPNVVVIGATTEPQKLPRPLIDRMAAVELVPYSQAEGAAIAKKRLHGRPADYLDIALRGRLNPRLIIALCERALDYETVQGEIDWEDVYRITGVGVRGLTDLDRQALACMRYTFDSSPVGLGSLASALGISAAQLASDVEPWLVKLGLIVRTPRGRILSQDGISHAG
jgi:Holliday junction DNA helicase RuvB